MKILATLIVSAIFSTYSIARTQATELLGNGDFEAGDTGWTITVDPANNEILTVFPGGFTNHTPGGFMGVWGRSFFGANPQAESTPVDGSISQIVLAQADVVYAFSGWSRFEPLYSGAIDVIDPNGPSLLAGEPSPTETTMELAFLDGGGSVLGTPVLLDLRTEQVNDNIWRQHTLIGTAPTGTVNARVTGSMIDGVLNLNGMQTMFFDDFSLTVIPEPTSATLCLTALALGMSSRRRNR